MTQSPTPSSDIDERRRLLAQIQVKRVFSSIPICWDEVEEILPFFNREDAVRFLNGEVDDLNRRVLYGELFRWHPALRTKLRPDLDVSEPTIIMLSRAELPKSAAPAAQLTASASASCAAAEVPGNILLASSGSDEVQVIVIPHTNPKWTTLRFLKHEPHQEITLVINDVEIQPVEPLDEKGYLVVQKQDIAPVEDDGAILEVIVRYHRV